MNHKNHFRNSLYVATSDMTARRNYDLTVGLFGIQVPVNSPIIEWKDGHSTILPAVYDDNQKNLCDTVDIPTIKYLAESHVSSPGSFYVTHLSQSDIATHDIQDVVGESLSQNKSVVIRGADHHQWGAELTAEVLEKYYAISPNRAVWVHGSVESLTANRSCDSMNPQISRHVQRIIRR